MRMRDEEIEEQVQQILVYVQGGLANIWKENLLENIKVGEMAFALVRDFLVELKREFREGNNELSKVAKLKKVE